MASRLRQQDTAISRTRISAAIDPVPNFHKLSLEAATQAINDRRSALEGAYVLRPGEVVDVQRIQQAYERFHLLMQSAPAIAAASPPTSSELNIALLLEGFSLLKNRDVKRTTICNLYPEPRDRKRPRTPS